MKSLTDRSYRIIAQAMKISSSDLKAELVEFLDESPDPTDELMHEWAEKNGYDIHEVEAEAYKLATLYVSFLKGGRFNSMDIDEDDVDPDELEMGIEVELEHTPDEEVAKRIALDHLAEMPDYYTKLKEMEEAGKGKKTARKRLGVPRQFGRHIYWRCRNR